MRKFLISATLMASTLAIAVPAAAQYGPPRGNAYGYNNNHGGLRGLQVRINRLEQEIRQLDRRNILSQREANRLGYQANMIERQLRASSYNGLNRQERQALEFRIARLEQNIRRQATDGNRFVNGGRGDNREGYRDRDRDGRNDRYEDDRGRNRD